MVLKGESDSIAETILSVEALLVSACDYAYQLSLDEELGGRYHDLIPVIVKIRKRLQLLEKLAGIENTAISDSAASMPHRVTTAQKSRINLPENEGSKKSQRRSKSYAFDFMLLDVLSLRTNIGRTIGLEQLFQAATHLVPGTQRNSLTAKLNRWRNEEKYLEWVSSDDMSITPKGLAFRQQLLLSAKNDKDLVNVPFAVKHAINVLPNYS